MKNNIYSMQRFEYCSITLTLSSEIEYMNNFTRNCNKYKNVFMHHANKIVVNLLNSKITFHYSEIPEIYIKIMSFDIS